MIANRNKKIQITSSSIGNYRRQRSSLKVNLSCISNLTDSGNDSLEQTDSNCGVNSSNIPLKNVQIILERISINKDNLSKEECDKQNEQSSEIHATQITKSTDFNKTSNHNTKLRVTKKNKLYSPYIVNKIQHINEKDNAKQGTRDTPKSKYKNKNVNKEDEQDKLKKRQRKPLKDMNVLQCVHPAFCDSKQLIQSKTKNYVNKNRLPETHERTCDSGEKDDHESNYSSICRRSASISSMSECGSDFMAIPIACSTMIDNEVSDNEVEMHFEHSSLQRASKSKSDSSYNKITEIVEADSISTIQTSLNVNTSVDALNEDCQNRSKHWNYETVKNKSKNAHSLILNTLEQSVSSVCTSLQMNTSLNRLQKSTIDLDAESEIDRCNLNNVENNSIDDQTKSNCGVQHQNEVFPEEIHDSEHNDNVNNSSLATKAGESTDKNEINNDQNIECLVTQADKIKRKRKLLPLQESQLASFSPVQKEHTPLQGLIFRKRCTKRKTNKCTKNCDLNSKEEHVQKGKNNKENREIKANKEKQRKPKKVISKKIVIKKTVNEDILRQLIGTKENSKSEEIDVGSKRNSLNDFQFLPTSSVAQSGKKQMQKLNIVTTGFSNEDKNLVKSIVTALGCAKIQPKVTKNTTHVITTGIRTINLLHGIIRGCWLVGIDWALKSLESNEWLSPEEYEMVHFSKAALENRKDRLLFGRSYVPELFAACGHIYISKGTKTPCSVLKDLVKTAGGCITEESERAKILIGTGGLKESWILDCITSGELQPCDQYQRS